MKKIFYVVFLSCILCFCIGCTEKTKDIPFNGVYNKEKDILITIGMPKTEVDALLGEYELLHRTEYTYFLNEPEHKIIVLYDYEDGTVRCVWIDTNNWRVHDKSCYVGANISDLSEDFMDTGVTSFGGQIYESYCDENGQVLDTSNLAQYYISTRTENNRVYRILVGIPRNLS